MEFQGMVFSDDLSMKGTKDYESFYEKTKQAIISGCEMILICNNRKGVLDGIRYFEENQIKPSEKVFSMLMANDISWINLEKDRRRIAISDKLEKLI
jgi:beta-N-acetylhexosaminidase